MLKYITLIIICTTMIACACGNSNSHQSPNSDGNTTDVIQTTIYKAKDANGFDIRIEYFIYDDGNHQYIASCSDDASSYTLSHYPDCSYCKDSVSNEFNY